VGGGGGEIEPPPQTPLGTPMIKVVKSRRIMWAGHVARMENRCAYKVLLINSQGDYLEDLSIEGSMVL